MSDTIFNNYLDSYSIKLDPQYEIERHVLDTGLWEAEAVFIFQRLLGGAKLCVDVGANVGFHTLAIVKSAGPGSRVVAFEPSTLCFPRLVDNINLNSSLRGCITCEKLALSNHEGVLQLCSYENRGNAQVVIESSENTQSHRTMELCLATTLDIYFAGSSIDFIKLDVEGHEYEVLQGATKILTESHPDIYYETHLACFAHDNMIALEKRLRTYGYKLFKLNKNMRLVEVSYPDYGCNTLALHHKSTAMQRLNNLFESNAGLN